MPKKYKLEISTIANHELLDIAVYHLHTVGVSSSRNISNKILQSLERLKSFPLSCPYIQDAELKSKEYRVLVCDEYVCIYRLIDDLVYVYHIAHSSTEYSKLFM